MPDPGIDIEAARAELLRRATLPRGMLRFVARGRRVIARPELREDGVTLACVAVLGELPFTAEAPEHRRQAITALLNDPRPGLTTDGRQIMLAGRVRLTDPRTPSSVVAAASTFAMRVDAELARLDALFPA